MTTVLEPPKPGEVLFLYDVMSPFSFLASKRINQMAHRDGLTVRWQPVYLAGVVKGSGNQTAVTAGIAPKILWGMRDYLLQAEATGIKTTFPAVFPQNPLTALRALIMLPQDALQRASEECFSIMFERAGSLEDPAAVADALARAGVNAEQALAAAATEEAKLKLRAVTDAAVELGAFGVPTFFVQPPQGELEMFWGNDHLAFALQRACGKPLVML